MTVLPTHVLTLWQPYATLVVRGWKNREFRSWFPGSVALPMSLAIHAAKRPMDDEKMSRAAFATGSAFASTPEWLRQCADVISDRELCPVTPPNPVTANALWPELIAGKGCIVGVVEVIGFEVDDIGIPGFKAGWAWRLENARRVQPTPWRGMQGLCRYTGPALEVLE